MRGTKPDLQEAVSETLRRAKERTERTPSDRVESSELQQQGAGESVQIQQLTMTLDAQQQMTAKLQKRLTELRWERRRLEKGAGQIQRRRLQLDQQFEVVLTAIDFAQRQTEDFTRRAQRLEEQLGEVFEERKRVARSVLATHDMCERLSAKLQDPG